MINPSKENNHLPNGRHTGKEEKDMMNRINDNMLENVVGGKEVQIQNKAASYVNLRTAPGLNSDVKMKLENGTWIGITDRTEKRDGYVWYEVYVVGCEDFGGWIAGSLLGL